MSVRRRASGLIASGVLGVGMVVSSSVPASAQTTSTCTVSAADQALDAEEQAFLTMLNQYRAQNGKRAVSAQTDVTRAAAWFSRDMATYNYFPGNHVDRNGRSIDARLRWCGVTFSNWAENIYAGTPDAQRTFNAWKNSATHNANMLRDGITAAGIARAYQAGSTYGWYWTLDVTNTTVATATTSTTVTATTTTTRPATTTTTTRPATTTTTRPATTTTTTVAPATTTTTAPKTTTTTVRPWYCAYYPQYC